MSEWKEYKLDEIAQILNSKRVPLSSMQRNIRKGKYPYYGASGIVDYIDDYIFDGEYVLISEDGENLRSRNTPIAFFAKGKFWVNNHSHIIKGKSDAINKWIIYYIKNLNISPYLTGAVQPKLNKENLLSIPFFLPSSNIELENIIEILSSLDDKIELNNKINQELETLAQTLFKRWFIDFEFPNENGEPYKSSGGKMVDSGLDEIPKGWTVGKFGDLANIVNGYAFKSKDFNQLSTEGIVKIRNINGIIVDIVNTDFVSSEVVNKLNNKFKIESGEILIAMTGAEVGKIGVVAKTNNRLWLNQRVGKIIPKNDKHISYIHTMFNVLNLTDVIRNEAMGSAQPNISSQGIENIKCLIPELKLIDEFSNLYNDKFRLFYHSLAENQELTILRDTLLPKLISGELEINENNN